MKPGKMSESIRGDLGSFCAVDTNQLQWTASPSGSVWRKRLHLVGPAESGQVTSVVRYDKNSSFPEHDHPDGEEILVLDGVFSDQQGDWPAGTFLLNPEGFRHAPFSRQGCELFVKLRQYPGRDRRHVATDTHSVPWQDSETPGLARKPLYSQQGYADTVELQKWAVGSAPGVIAYPAGAEIFIIDGSFSDETGHYKKGCWLRFPAGASHRLQTSDGCTIYIKQAGLEYLVPGEQSSSQ